MPVYEFCDTVTNLEFTEIMDNSKREEFLRDNPHIIQIFTSAPGLVDSARIGVTKVDKGFRDVLKKIHKRTPGSTLDRTAAI